ncbi:MAG: hypothetical protein JWQ24_3147 [Tardiphaga sp.]|nr:hypothetical protein [Tardiphaga sp.]
MTGGKGNVEFSVDEDGVGRSFLKSINSVAIHNITDITNYAILRDDTATSHYIVFRDGGEVRLSYKPDGRLLEFTVSRAAVKIANTGHILIKCKASEENS